MNLVCRLLLEKNFFNDTATTEIYTLSLHDALPIFFARPFKNRMVGVAVGTFMAGFLRFMCSFLSGVLVWGNLNEGLSAWTYSLVYNGSYMLPETLLTMVAAVLLCRVAPQIFDRQHAKA